MVSNLKIPTEQLSEETKKLFDVLNSESDLAVVLIATSFLDACLKSILENKLLVSSVTDKILDHRGSLGNLSARADLCYILGIISKGWYTDLCTFAEIRNIFAHHHLQQTFDSSEIVKKCAGLLGSRSIMPHEMSPRNHFTISAATLANWLLIRALEIKKESKIESPKEPSVTYVRVDGTKE